MDVFFYFKSASYTLYCDRSGFAHEYGTVNGGINKSFSGTFNKTFDITKVYEIE